MPTCAKQCAVGRDPYQSTKEVLETTPPEILSDIMYRGIYLVGGGALIQGLGPLLAESLKIPVHIAEEPLTAVARGTGNHPRRHGDYKDVLIQNETNYPTEIAHSAVHALRYGIFFLCIIAFIIVWIFHSFFSSLSILQRGRLSR